MVIIALFVIRRAATVGRVFIPDPHQNNPIYDAPAVPLGFIDVLYTYRPSGALWVGRVHYRSSYWYHFASFVRTARRPLNQPLDLSNRRPLFENYHLPCGRIIACGAVNGYCLVILTKGNLVSEVCCDVGGTQYKFKK